jgi:hypothetical protein
MLSAYKHPVLLVNGHLMNDFLIEGMRRIGHLIIHNPFLNESFPEQIFPFTPVIMSDRCWLLSRHSLQLSQQVSSCATDSLLW